MSRASAHLCRQPDLSLISGLVESLTFYKHFSSPSTRDTKPQGDCFFENNFSKKLMVFL
ncbi:hypothetical protein MXB_4945 [Myxobolus squamalis]|nr:hypothetical protein MXB_4945 [Myxobolus squamalis]